MANGAGYVNNPIHAVLSDGEVDLWGNDSEPATFTTDGSGNVTAVLWSSNVTRTCTISCGSKSATVEFQWDTPELPPSHWQYDPYFWYGEWEPVSVSLCQRGIPLDNHTMKFYVTRVKGVEWDPLTEGYVNFDYNIDDDGDLSYYSEFADDANGHGDGIVSDDEVAGTYKAYQVVHDQWEDGVYTDWVEFWVVDEHCYSRASL
jgi:hypothetical protein